MTEPCSKHAFGFRSGCPECMPWLVKNTDFAEATVRQIDALIEGTEFEMQVMILKSALRRAYDQRDMETLRRVQR